MKQRYSALPFILILCISLSITAPPLQAETLLNSNTPGDATGQISGRVTDDEGHPLSGITTYAYQADGNGVWKEVNFGMTDATGAYTICCLAAGVYRVGFTSERYYSEYYDNVGSVQKATDLPVASGMTVTNINAQLAHKGRIRGRVTDKLGGPLRGIGVTVYSDPDNTGLWSVVDFGLTDNNGAYSIEGLAPGIYRIGFGGYGGLTGEYYKNATAVEQATNIKVVQNATVNGIDAQLAGPTGRIQGVVTNEANELLAEADIVVYQDADHNGAWEGVAREVTDANGVYIVPGLQDGVYRVEFSDIVYQWKNYPFQRYAVQYYNAMSTVAAATDVVIQAGNTVTNINARLAKAGRIRGRVTDLNNNPLSGIWVDALSSVTSAECCFASSTDANGVYEVGVANGVYRIFFNTRPGMSPYIAYTAEYYDNVASFEAATDLPVKEREVVAAIDAQLAPAGTIRGQVTDLNGVRLSQIKVTAYSAVGDSGLWTLFSTAVTDAAGAYAIPGVGGSDNSTSVTYRVGFEDLRTPPQYHAKVYRDTGYPETGEDILALNNQEVSGINVQLAPFASINLAPLAHPDRMLVFLDAQTKAWLSDGSVLANDRDAEAEPLNAVLVDAPSQGALTLNANGVFTYTPTASVWISDTFTYRAHDQSHASDLTSVTFFPGAGRLFLPVVMR
ncbi:MAG: carboxypeptidase regulatory-like domain-containing protein [Caldilineaceae bacterium]